MNVLALSLAHSLSYGSESLVGYRVVEALTDRFDTTLITSAGMDPPQFGRCETIPVRFDEPNDVSAWQLFRFEREQCRLVERHLGTKRFDIVHRVTPSGLKDSMLPLPEVPLILGPVLLSEPLRPAFRKIFMPSFRLRWSLEAGLRRVQHAIARRAFGRWSTLEDLLNHAAVILVGTRTTLEQLPLHLHSRCRHITYAGVEQETYRPATHKTANRIPQLLFAGRVVAYKGVELLLRAVARAIKSCPFELKIVGGGSSKYRDYCRNLTKQLGLLETVEFAESKPRAALAELYRTSDIFCMPSIETYGIAILEAMSSGCSVLVSDINGPREIVQPGTGLKVPLETPEQFVDEYAARIVELVESPGLRAELGEAAREHVVRHHDWSKIQASLLDIYAELRLDQSHLPKHSSEPIATV